jgi:diacylglycerol kinase family enzyme
MGQMMWTPRRKRPPGGRHIVTATGLDSLTIRCSRPVAFHVDGEYLGETESVKFQFVSNALRVVAPIPPTVLAPRSGARARPLRQR